MFPLLDDAISPEVPLKDKVCYYGHINQVHGANMDPKQIPSVKDQIVELIGNPLTRCEGLLLFESLLLQSTSFYHEKWHLIVKANLQSSNVFCQEITFRILKLILRPSQCTSHVTTVQFYIPSIVDILLEPNLASCVGAIQCLSMCLKIHPYFVNQRKEALESFIVRQMDTNSTQMSEALSECFVNLFRGIAVAPGNKESTSSKPHVLFYKKTLYTLQEILNKILHSSEVFLIDTETNDGPPEIFPLPNIPEVEFSATMTLSRTFSSLSVSTAKVLCSKSVGLFEVPVLWILEFMNRIFEMTQLLKNARSDQQRQLLILSYPFIQKGTFTILESLIQNFCLVEQVENILLLIRKSVETSYISSFTNMCNCQIRYISWRILNVWIIQSGVQVSFDAGNRKFLIQELLKDIIIENADETLKTSPIKGAKSPKAKKADSVFPKPDESSNFNQSRIQTCIEALQVLKTLICTVSPFLEEKFKEEISHHVLATSKTVQKNIHPEKKFPFPYVNVICRRNLYRVNLALILSSSYSARIVSQCHTVLNIANREQSLEIKKFCRFTIPKYRLLLHPKKKLPEVVRNKVAYESAVEENIDFGWENAPTWNTNNSDETNNTDEANHSSDRHVNFPSETPNNMTENERQNDFIPEKNYSFSQPSSEVDSSYEKGEIQCNGDDVSEVQISSQSESESEETMENETAEDENNPDFPGKPFADVHQNLLEKEHLSEEDISSDEDNLSIAEEEAAEDEQELEDTKVEEEETVEEIEIDSSEHGKTVVCTDQNGIASTDEEEKQSSLVKTENGDYSSEEEGSLEEEEIDHKETVIDQKHEAEISEHEPPFKKQRLSTESCEVNEVCDMKIETVNDAHVEKEDVKQSTEEIPSEECKSPTVEEMCADFVFKVNAELAES